MCNHWFVNKIEEVDPPELIDVQEKLENILERINNDYKENIVANSQSQRVMNFRVN